MPDPDYDVLIIGSGFGGSVICALAERAPAMWPNKGEPDPRPDLGMPYRPVRPIRPQVPAGTPGELRLPGDNGLHVRG
jgi:hypothetical protein